MLCESTDAQVMTMPLTLNFSFQALELTGQLRQAFNESLTGCWQIQLTEPAGSAKFQTWYLEVVQGRVVFSGIQQLSWGSLITTLQRYISRLREPRSQQMIDTLKLNSSPEELSNLSQMLKQMVSISLLTEEEASQALRTKVLSDLDMYLFKYSGKAQFISDPHLANNSPTLGFDLNGLLLEAVKRRVEWSQLENYLPTVDTIVMLSPDAAEGHSLNSAQKQQLQSLIKEGRKLEVIAYKMGKDTLGTAKVFAPLIQKGVLNVVKPGGQNNQPGTPFLSEDAPEVFIVDDSPVLTKQFQSLVVTWGYQVKSSSDALSAVQTMSQSKPAIIFLDINMPGASGFDLIKQIRRQPKLASTPIVLLTAEKTVSNQWRAQWASCKFLAKPRTPDEIPGFRTELRGLLRELVPTVNDALI
jgi:CheY-like chemotaxis protein